MEPWLRSYIATGQKVPSESRFPGDRTIKTGLYVVQYRQQGTGLRLHEWDADVGGNGHGGGGAKGTRTGWKRKTQQYKVRQTKRRCRIETALKMTRDACPQCQVKRRGGELTIKFYNTTTT